MTETLEEKATCTLCEELITDQEERSTENGEPCCYGCEESELERAATIVKLSGGKTETFILSENFGYDNYGDSIDRDLYDVDGEGFATIADTIEVTNGSDLWGMETDIRDVAERLKSDAEEGILPFEAYVTIKQTGNFAVYMTVNVAESDRDAWNLWLNDEYVEEDGE